MSFLAKLFINNRVINVLDTNIQFYQQVDYSTLQPESIPNGGLFTITIEADGAADLLGLALSPDTMSRGYIRFYKRDGFSKLTDYEFFDTYVVQYERHFRAFSGTPATDTFTFSPGILRIGDMVFEKSWKVTDLNNYAAPTALEPEMESEKSPRIVDYYITDNMNNRIEKAEIGETIFLNIKTKDMIGEDMTISLNDQTVDFKYQGELLADDTLRNIQVKKDMEKIELEVVAQQKEDL
ncbi:type VI secretion system tube protein TssD [Spongiimicrobium salis]|uniref:type VI secretion system tube protein TssD n=1 Tax=Spongiimicrobium salis TaxID=1667022 RepID=UPI00374D4F52